MPRPSLAARRAPGIAARLASQVSRQASPPPAARPTSPRERSGCTASGGVAVYLGMTIPATRSAASPLRVALWGRAGGPRSAPFRRAAPARAEGQGPASSGRERERERDPLGPPPALRTPQKRFSDLVGVRCLTEVGGGGRRKFAASRARIWPNIWPSAPMLSEEACEQGVEPVLVIGSGPPTSSSSQHSLPMALIGAQLRASGRLETLWNHRRTPTCGR